MSQDHFILPVTEIKEVNRRHIILCLDVEGSDYSFRAGKHATVTLPEKIDSPGRLSRIFSIASSPNDRKNLMFATTYRGASRFKQSLLAMKKGDKLGVSPPSGGFFLISDLKRPILFITSEIGITPVMSILTWAGEEGLFQRIHLIYVNPVGYDILFREDLEKIISENSSITMHLELTSHSLGDPSELITLEYLRESAPDMDILHAMFYTSGKPPFVKGVRKALIAAGISAGSIKMESFSGY